MKAGDVAVVLPHRLGHDKENVGRFVRLVRHVPAGSKGTHDGLKYLASQDSWLCQFLGGPGSVRTVRGERVSVPQRILATYRLQTFQRPVDPAAVVAARPEHLADRL